MRARLTVMISQGEVALVQAVAESHAPNCEQVIQSWHISTARVWHPPLSAGIKTNKKTTLFITTNTRQQTPESVYTFSLALVV